MFTGLDLRVDTFYTRIIKGEGYAILLLISSGKLNSSSSTLPQNIYYLCIRSIYFRFPVKYCYLFQYHIRYIKTILIGIEERSERSLRKLGEFF